MCPAESPKMAAKVKTARAPGTYVDSDSRGFPGIPSRDPRGLRLALAPIGNKRLLRQSLLTLMTNVEQQNMKTNQKLTTISLLLSAALMLGASVAKADPTVRSLQVGAQNPSVASAGSLAY